MPYALTSAALSVTLLLVVAGTAADEEPPTSKPGEGLVLLRNGNVLQGMVTRVGDRYHVSVRDGDLSIRAADVEFVGRNFDEIYRHRRSTIRTGVARDHLKLADWCLRNRLLDYANRELSDASLANPKHPRIAILERRLKLADRQSEPLTRDPATSPRPTAAELDRMVKGLPAGSVKTFSVAIQPMLLNRCGAAVCHGSRSESGFRLLRPSDERTPSRRMILRNLYSTRKWINRTDPDASLILIAPLEPHGTSPTAIFASRDDEPYRRLANWISQIAGEQRAQGPSRVEAPAKPLFEQMLSPSRDMHVITGPRRKLTMPSAAASALAADTPRRPAREESSSASFVPVDEFDPEIFNRLYGSPKNRVGKAIEIERSSKLGGE